MANSELKFTISADSGSALGVLSQLSREVRNTTTGIESSFGGLSKVIDNFKAPLMAVTGILGGGAFLKGAVNETKQWTMEAQKLSKTLGISTESASVLNLAVGDIYGSMDEFLPLIGKLTKTLNSNEGAFKTLGVATRDSQGHLRPTLDVMTEVNERLMTMKSGTDRNVASMQIYGKGWQEVQRYLGLTPAVMEAAREKAEKLNLIVGADAVTATNNYRASMNDLEDSVKALKLRLGQELMPVITQFNDAAAEEGPTALNILGGALKGIVEIIDGAWSGFKMFSIGLVGLVDAACRYVITTLSTVWGFLSAGIPGAKKAWAEGNKGIKEDWSATIAAMDRVGIAYQQRQGERWEGWGRQRRKANAPGGTGHADTDDHRNASKAAEEAARKAAAAEFKAWTDRAAAARKLQDDLTGLEQDGLGKRLAAIRKHFDDLRAENAKAARSEAELRDKEQLIRRAQDKAEAEAKREQVKDDLRALREELAQIAQIKGGLGQGDINEVLARYKSKGGTSAEAATQYSREEHLGEGRGAGVQAGLRGFMAQSQNTFNTWKNSTTSILNSVESAFSSFFSSVLTSGGSFTSKLQSLWKGLANTVIKSLSDMAAKHLINWGIEKAMAAWKKADTTAEIGLDQAKNAAKIAGATQSAGAAATETTAATTATGANVGKATSGFFSAFSSIPFVGLGLALAAIAVMMQVMKSITAHAVGGVIDHPTLALMCEAGTELVAPEKDFKTWAAQLSGASYNLGANLGAHDAQISRLNNLSGSYSRNALASNGGSVPPALNIHINGGVYANSLEGQRAVREMVATALTGIGKKGLRG